MTCSCKVIRSCSFLILFLSMFLNSGRSQQTDSPQLRVLLIGFADRWADYGSRGDTPGFRDFLGVLHQPTGGKSSRDVFVKLRFLYWQEGKSDPKHLAEGPAREMSFAAAREASCDETFASLSRSKQVSFLDPQLKPSRFVIMSHAPVKRPRAQSVLPCYQVK
jgi:hypothetical protein